MDVAIHLDRARPVALQRQLADQLRSAILSGLLPAGTRLPASRALAESLGVSRNLVVTAYDELFADGYVAGRHGSGTYVAADLPTLPRPVRAGPAGVPRWLRDMHVALAERSATPGEIEFTLGKPSLEGLPRAVWRRVWKSVLDQLPPADYREPAGELELRDAVARYLGRARGIACAADDVVVTLGAVQGFDLVARATLAAGDAVGFEEPGYPTARQVLLSHGAKIVPVPVDSDGLRVQALPTGAEAPLLVYVTPSHQYPLGARLSFARRLALLEWARANDSLIVEDDYDSEFRYDAPPLPALAGMDGEGRVAYVGTFSKLLSPALRLGYVVAPRPLRERIVWLKRLTDYHAPWPLQRAMATFVGEGHLERHVRRMRRHYAAKRAVLIAALAPLEHLVRPLGLEAGLHCCLELRVGLDADEIVERARRREVIVTTLEAYYYGRQDRQGLLLGYGGLNLAEVERGATILAESIGRAAATSLPTASELPVQARGQGQTHPLS